ncbi:OLC1v1003993C1 [Oldenlandia corymbosa var. corymbosa]|uniref:OLC1v1003993C1 n=1 Tax=Oldenlandia corymbosa var. corymbosa TaxID=529605 RepID=A0AAV1DDN6_OLDCO|nr:OLC1v1003993C1 [Oldenlandia corymbosa var. corymbosa]
MSTGKTEEPVKHIDWKNIGKSSEQGGDEFVKKRLPKKIRQIPDSYFLPRKSLPSAIAFYSAWIVAGVGAGMLAEIWIKKKIKVSGRIPKSKADGKSSEPPTKSRVKEPFIVNKEKRVFGTVRNPNVPASKPVTEKVARKPGIPQRPSKQPINHPSLNPTAVQETEGTPKKLATTKKKSVSFREKVNENKEKTVSEEGNQTPLKSPFSIKPGKKKSVNFGENVEEVKDKILQEDDVVRTPLRSPFLVKANNNVSAGTPYQSAERCSKCRFDKLETSSYWIAQVRLAESVGKHFVSAASFRLASDCKAEPIRNVKVELKKYIGRHGHLSEEKEWKDLCVSFGLRKEESSNISQDNQEVGTTKETEEGVDQQQEEKQQITVDDAGVVEPCECE